MVPYIVPDLLRTMCTKFYQNRWGFVEDMRKHFGVFFGSQRSSKWRRHKGDWDRKSR